MGAHHHHDSSLPERAAIAAISVALTLVAVKFFAWIATDSLSLLSSLVDSLVDSMISGVNYLAVRYARKPADEEHRFGHTGIEDIVGLLQAAFIFGTAVFITVNGIQRLIIPTDISYSIIGVGVMLFSIVLTSLLVLYQRHAIKQTGSLVIQADSLHYLGDVLVNFTVIISLLLVSAFSWRWADPLFAILIAGYLCYGAWQIGSRSYRHLMDAELPDEDRKKIELLIQAEEGVRGYHHLKTRYSGRKAFIQFHAELDGNQTLEKAHIISDRLEQAIMNLFPDAEVIIHQDPV